MQESETTRDDIVRIFRRVAETGSWQSVLEWSASTVFSLPRYVGHSILQKRCTNPFKSMWFTNLLNGKVIDSELPLHLV